MVGKIKHVRQKLHQEAVKLEGPPAGSALPRGGPEPPGEPAPTPPHVEKPANNVRQVLTQSAFPSGIFVGTKITPENLVQTLKLEAPPDVAAPIKKDPEEKRAKSKKEKMKERRDRWLSKISSIKQAKERERAEAQRQATPVVGDMRPLADALPELCQLIGPSAAPAPAAPTSRRQSRKTKPVMRRPRPTDFSQMRHSQKRKLLEAETSRFFETVRSLHAKTNPLVDIGEQLRKRMRQEEEQGPS